MLHRLIPVIVLPLLALAPSRAAAQAGDTGLRSRIEQELFTFGDCGQPLCLDLPNAHGNHFLPALSEGNDAVIAFLTGAIGKATSSVPLSATSSGATFSFVAGLPVRTSTSAGPIFGERSQTLGRGRFFLGASVTGMEFTSLNGAPLDNLLLNFKHENTPPVSDSFGDPIFENDVIALQLAMHVDVLVGTLAMTYGLTDFIDVGVAVPVVRTSVSGRSDAQILPFTEIPVHRFGGDIDNPVLRASASMDGSAAGIGDVAARLKVNLGQGAKMGAALLAEVRFPTGDEKNLLGSGDTQIRALGVYSAQLGSFSPHVNVGYLARGGEAQNDAVLFSAIFDNLVTEWATIAVGVESEWQVGDDPFVLPEPVQFDLPFPRRIPATNVPTRAEDLLRATLGGKFIVRGGTVIVANALLPLRDAGLQPDFIWTLGLDFPF